MFKKDPIVVGFNHMFLYPESMVNGETHKKTLRQIAENEDIDALDCWVWAANAKEELSILKNCKKAINYNIGDRFGERAVFPATADLKEKAYALDILRRETEFALEAGAKKMVFGSGKDVPTGRDDAKKRFMEFVLQWAEYIPKDVWLTLEPTDRDIDKCFLFGDMAETCQMVHSIRQNGMSNIGILLDMGHIPLMHQTLENAAKLGGDLLEHIHLGNCIIKDKQSPFYGDKHPCWGYAGGEYNQKDGECFLKYLQDVGYFTRGNPRTVSFEMRPMTGKTARETINDLANWIKQVYETL